MAVGTQGTVNLNTASRRLLRSLPGIDQKLARRIVRYRRRQGPFQQMSDLLQVEGVSKDLLKPLQAHLEVAPPGVQTQIRFAGKAEGEQRTKEPVLFYGSLHHWWLNCCWIILRNRRDCRFNRVYFRFFFYRSVAPLP